LASPSEQIAKVIGEVLPILRAVSEPGVSVAPADAWSAKQVLGHLIDSAANNHQRFVRAQFTDDLVFPGYAQEEWVLVQGYQAAAWHDLLDFWSAYNLHLVRIIALIPAEVRLQPRTWHNLDQLAWQSVAGSTSVTLEYFMNDYVRHLKHHLCQIFDLLGLPRTSLLS
jgi:hypothetical protein